MKVLVVDLLRIGDFLMKVPVLNGLQVDRLDVLTFENTRILAPMLPRVQRWWTLDRDELQRGLGEFETPMLTSFHLLQEQLEALSAERYDCVINLSQTRFSAWVSGYIETSQRQGLQYDQRGRAQFHSSWFEHLDQHLEPGDSEAFHFTDIFFEGCQLGSRAKAFTMHETPVGLEQVKDLHLPARPIVILQLLTSDVKKNWPPSSFDQMVHSMHKRRDDLHFVVLGAPFEQTTIQSFTDQLVKSGVSAQVAVLSLEGALSLLNRSDLLVTGDTSIKHLANAAKVRVVELSLGSSDWRRTGIYKADSLILQGVTSCVPCPHSSPCGQKQHLCSQPLKPSWVADMVLARIADDWESIAQLARRDAGDTLSLRTQVWGDGLWFPCPMAKGSDQNFLHALTRQAATKFFLNRQHTQALAPFGSEVNTLKNQIVERFPEIAWGQMVSGLDFLPLRGSAHGNSVPPIANSWQEDRLGFVERRRSQIQNRRLHELQFVQSKFITSLKTSFQEGEK